MLRTMLLPQIILFGALIGSSGVTALFIIPSMLMAMSAGGLLMGKMTLGGLLMMMMAANQQGQGQSFLRNLGIIPHASPSTGISVPTYGSSGSSGDIQELIVRKRREVNGTSRTMIVDQQTQYRVMRQVASSDPLGCLPSALCGISASPPSAQSGFLNDYAYLLKTVFSRDDESSDLDEEFDDLKYEPSTPKNKKKKTSKKKEKDSEESSEELDDVGDDQVFQEKRKEYVDLHDIANDEVLSKNPEFLPYALRDSMKTMKKNGPPPLRPGGPLYPPEVPDFMGYGPGDLTQMSESELDAMLSKLDGGSSEPELPQRPESLLSRIIPKISMGLTPGKSSEGFGDDPFFAGFKRSIEEQRSLKVDKISLRPATPEEEKLFNEMKERRRLRRAYLSQAKKELAEIQDPVEKFRIAAEFGTKSKSPRQCRVLFNNCPFNYTQVLGMVADFRKAIMGQPLNEPKVAGDSQKQSGQSSGSNVINVNAGSTGAMGGVTSIMHELPSGEKVEISLKMTNGGAILNSNSKPLNSTSLHKVRVKPGNSQGAAEIEIQKQNEETMQDLDGLKATMMAIQKINNGSIQLKKEKQPTTAQILEKLELKTTASSSAAIEKPADLKVQINHNEKPNLVDPPPQPQKNLKGPNKSNDPQKTASEVASTFINTKLYEDDEFDDQVLSSTGINRVMSSTKKTNAELKQILKDLKKEKKKARPSKEEDVSDDATDEEEEDADEEEEEEDVGDEIERYKSGIYRKKQPVAGVKHTQANRIRVPPHRANSGTSNKNIKKPRKLFSGHNTLLRAPAPL